MSRHTSCFKRTQLPHSEHLPSGIGHTGNPLGIGHTGNRSDQEHGSVRTRRHSDVSCSSRRDSNTRRNTISFQHNDPGEHSLASMIRQRPARSRSRSYDSVSPRRHSCLTSRSRGKKKKEHSKSHSSKRDKSRRSTRGRGVPLHLLPFCLLPFLQILLFLLGEVQPGRSLE